MTATASNQSTRTERHRGQQPSPGGPRAMLLAFGLTSVFMLVELIGGLLSNSLALMADAGHMISDAAALGLGLFAMWVANRPHTQKLTFGFHRAEILAALANGMLLLGIALFVSFHALSRLRDAPDVAGGPVMAIASLGLIVNLVAMKILGSHNQGSLNIRAAFLHLLSDVLGSIGVIFSGVVIHFTGWTPIDGVISIFISVLILVSGGKLVRETVSVLLESSPYHLDTEAVKNDLKEIDGVSDIHDLHVWTVTSGFVSLSAHAEVVSSEITDEVLRKATVLLRERYGIRHITIQAETSQIHDELEHCCLGEHKASLSFRSFLSQH